MTSDGAVERLELVELGAVDDPGDHLARVERRLQVGRHEAEEVLLVVHRRGDVGARRRAELAPVEAGDDAPPEADGVELVGGEVVGEPGDPGVHLGAAERLVVGLLAGRHLHQRRPGEEHLGPVLDHHDVVGHARQVGAAGGRVAEHEGDRRDPVRRRPGEVAERAPAGDEDLLLGRQVGAAGLDEVDHRQPVLEGDVGGAERLAQRERVARPASHGRVVGADQALDAADDADAGDDAGADGVRRVP